jgi:hypothetical protein
MPIAHNSDSLVTRNLTVEDLLALAEDTVLEFREIASAATPPPGRVVLYARSDGRLYVKDDSGAEARLSVGTVARILYIENPLAADSFPLCYVPEAAQMVAVRAITDVGTVDFNIEKRSKLTPDVAGTDVWSADKQATTAGLEQTTFDAGAIGEHQWLHYSASAIVSSPAKLWISVEYRAQ